jgi:beta-1,4-N-acetylglucosaminyltransferase
LILVAVSTLAFERLVRKMDEIAGRLDEEVIMQIGQTKFIPKNAKCFDFITEDELKGLCQKARVVVTHGAMIILDALEQGTSVIAVPRLNKYGEHIDDHQLYFVKELEKNGMVIAVYDVDNLEEVLRQLETKPINLVKDRSLVDYLKRCIDFFERVRDLNTEKM